MNGKTFFDLKPHDILDTIDTLGFRTTAELIQLNSYENRVFDLGVESNNQFGLNRVIAKFYRPGRWSKQSILEEHIFLKDLSEEGIPVCLPLEIEKIGSTLVDCDGIYLSLFPKIKGRMPQEFIGEQLRQVGRRLAQLHNVGEKRKSHTRPTVGSDGYGGWPSLEILQNWVCTELWSRYEEAAVSILHGVENSILLSDETKKFNRIHGDCHKGNLLHNGSEFFFVDFDDMCMGPAVQDFWMLLNSDINEASKERDELLIGYEELRSFNDEEWELIPLLQGLRIIGYSAWIAQRWTDPSFPKLFPEFNTYKYWAIETESLERIAWSL